MRNRRDEILEENRSTPYPKAPTANESAGMIVLVEDEAIIALDCMKRLQHRGFQVLHVVSGEAVLGIVQNMPVPPKAIILDMNLGAGMDGACTARKIRALCESPIVFHSGMEEFEVLRRTHEIPNARVVRKGSPCGLLERTVISLIG